MAVSEKTSYDVPQPFYIKDCALAPIATGIKAQTVTELCDRLKVVSVESIYYHFWRQSIETSLKPGSFYNDFSHWAHYELHDDFLAERLTLIDPSAYEDLEKLRLDIIDVVENRIDEHEGGGLLWAHASEPFYFVKSKIVIFNTTYKMEHPKELVKVIPAISLTSIFYHFIEARRREHNKIDDFSTWLHGYGDQFLQLIERFKLIDPYFIPLADLQQKLSLEVNDYFLNKET